MSRVRVGASSSSSQGTRAGSGPSDVSAEASTNLTRDALQSVVDQKLAPFKEPKSEEEKEARENETALETATRVVGGALALISLPEDLANTGFAMATASLAKVLPSFPAATLFMPHLGLVHCHTHPPALPLPLPSLGVVLLGGCYSVLINGIPAARAGDLGLAITCGSLGPPFEVFTGSSKVFIGGARAARMLDITKHCMPGSGGSAPASLLGKLAQGAMMALPVVLGAAGVALGAAGAVNQANQSDKSEDEAEQYSQSAAANSASAADNKASAEKAAAGVADAAAQGDTAKAEALAEQAAESAGKAAEQEAMAAEEGAMAESMGAMAAGQALGATTQAAQTAADAASLAARLLMGKDPGGPPAIGALIAGHPNVLIGGFPMPPWGAILGGLLKKLKKKVRNKETSDKLHAMMGARVPAKLRRLRSFLSKLICFLTGHPVDVMAGRMLTDDVDFELLGPLPLKVERNYSSTWGSRDSVLGYGWSHTLDQAVWLEDNEVVYRAEDGRELCFEFARDVDLTRPLESFDPFNRLTLTGHGKGRFTVESPDGQLHEFAIIPGETSVERRLARLVELHTRAGHRIRLEYDVDARLEWVYDSGGRKIHLHNDEQGRLVRVSLPHPDHQGQIRHVDYRYSEAGDLVEVTDALGESTRYLYDNHRMVQHTLRTGLSFFFEYDGPGTDAFCVHTWGDGGIYDHTLVYDKQRRVTVVTNSLGEATIYTGGGYGEVVQITDARGAVTRYEYDEHLRKTAEIDPLGNATRYEYDGCGSCTKVVGPDETTVEVTYDERTLPVAAVDEVGGQWSWAYDELRRLVRRVDPLGRVTSYVYDGAHVAELVDPAGRRLRFEHDASGNLEAVHFPDESTQRWVHDFRGRVREVIDVRGNVESYRLDLRDQVVHVDVPDGDQRELTYDGEGSLVRFRSRFRDIAMTYTGMGRLASRSEAGTTVGFLYDTEEQLQAITNEHGEVYRFERDPTGEVSAEYGFDGIRRLYLRDLAGRVSEVMRASGIRTRCVYDQAGRITAVEHSDGSGDRFAYREDGALIEAIRAGKDGEEIPVRFERDVLGRVLRELQGDHWVASAYDEVGFRRSLRSSLGAHQEISRNVMGDVTRVEAVGSGWSADFSREIGGFEAERLLPGGLRSAWQRDRLGRPVEHRVTVEGRAAAPGERAPVLSTLRDRRYTWDVDLRLRKVKDATRGPIEYTHDDRGYLVSAEHSNGDVELRMPDAVGNLFKREDRSDRKYGPGGELLESADAEGRVTLYAYDAEGNLAAKTMPDGRRWEYRWSASGMLAEVVRPDSGVVRFAYDALGRRVWKEFGERRTRWVWDGDVPLHEWVEVRGEGPVSGAVAGWAGAGLRAGGAMAEEVNRRAANPSIGPPVGEMGGAAAEVTTWLFEPGGFSPMAKLRGAERLSIVTDHLATPVMMVDGAGATVWSASLGVFGAVRAVEGEGEGGAEACPFRWAGQYEDAETGLRYSRFRYFDPDAGRFVSQDPIGLVGGAELYGYPGDPLAWVDPLGLAKKKDCKEAEGGVETTRVGRWMSPDELVAMQKTGVVQEGSGGFSRVAVPVDSTAYKAAPKGDVFVTYDVPTSSLKSAGKKIWRAIPGPNSMYARLAVKNGEPVPQMPKFQNLKVEATK